MSPATVSRTGIQKLFADYRPIPGAFDEMLAADGTPRSHWLPLLQFLESLGRDEVQRRWQHAQRQISSEGIIFNPFDATGTTSRPWSLDAIPSVISEEDWEQVTEGLRQRARLWELTLADLFGPQRLIREKVLPPELLFAHPLYSPAFHGLIGESGRYLTLYAAELARTPDGGWWITGDRTRAPLGLGYALENRIVTSHMLPEAFRQCHVHRLATFFMFLQNSLRQQASRYQDNPRIVLWSQGHESYAYFEDAYLARYLGYPLVEGGDLAVRDDRVMLKTLGGLLPVEVLFRRVDDEVCDPVELSPNQRDGVSGLLEVIRSRNVVVANGIGSRLVESPAFQAFLPAICRYFLAEELKIANVPTSWCGDEAKRGEVERRFDELVFRPAFRTHPTKSVRPSTLERRDRDALWAHFRDRPEDLVACEPIERSTTPVWCDNGLQTWRFALRAFLLADSERWEVLPGGLARLSPDSLALDQAMSEGERSQDVWVLSKGPVEDVTLLRPSNRPMELRRTSAELPSRVADNLLWLGRYVERADAIARLLRTVLSRMVESPEDTPGQTNRLLRVLAEYGLIEPGYVLRDLAKPLPKIEENLPEAMFNRDDPSSLLSTVQEALRLASTVRERLALDAWRIIHRIGETCRRPDSQQEQSIPDLIDVLDQLITELSAFAGLVGESMTRTQAWRFLDLGRRLERALQTITLLQATLTEPERDEGVLLETVLRILDSIMTYRTRYLATLQPAPVLDLLLVDETNPRSVGFQLAAIANHVECLPRDPLQAIRGPDQKLALSLFNTVRLVDVHSLAEVTGRGERPQLSRLLNRLSDQLHRLSEVLAGRYLIHAGLPRHLASLRGNVP